MSYYVTYLSKVKATGDIEQNTKKALNLRVTKEVPEIQPHPRQALIGQAVSYAVMLHNNVAIEYTTFRIKKRTKGYRTIEAPSNALMEAQKAINKELQNKHVLCHNAAHAFVKYRNTKTALKVHQDAGSRWFLKVDLKDFFTNCTSELVKEQLLKLEIFQKIDQFWYLFPKSTKKESVIDKMLRICCNKGVLPQGAPTSPVLANLTMLEFDHKLTQALPTFTYTRYADDLLISSKTHFDYKVILKIIESLLPKPHKINYNKVRYGNCNGANWNLGIMYNKDQNITVGHHNKHVLKSRMYNLMKTPKENWEENQHKELQKIRGLLSYYQAIEPTYFKHLIDQWKFLGYL